MQNQTKTLSEYRGEEFEMSTRTKAQLDEITGSLSNTSKMPCKSWGIPASYCKTGSKLAKIAGSTCSGCYALKGAYRWSNVSQAYERRLKAFEEDHLSWSQAMVETIKRSKTEFFRFFDSGDLQSLEMLESIVWIASRLPNVKFWLPTREVGILRDYVKTWGANWPSNLTIRLSATMVDGVAPKAFAKAYNIRTSTVVSSGANCPSSKQDGKCLDCRACWESPNNISYLKH